MRVIEGIIQDYNNDGEITVKAKINLDDYLRCNYKRVRLMPIDSRIINDDQRKKIYALLTDIADYTGNPVEYMKTILKDSFIAGTGMEFDLSLSNCEMSLASAFIDYIIAFVLMQEIPLSEPLKDYYDDVKRYAYISLKYGKCAVCGRDGEIHHVDAIGMGRDRAETVHEGMRAICLCRQHHSEAHRFADFMDRYHLEPAILDKFICTKYKLKKGEK